MPRRLELTVAPTSDEAPGEGEENVPHHGREVVLLLVFIVGGIALGSCLGSVFTS